MPVTDSHIILPALGDKIGTEHDTGSDIHTEAVALKGINAGGTALNNIVVNADGSLNAVITIPDTSLWSLTKDGMVKGQSTLRATHVTPDATHTTDTWFDQSEWPYFYRPSTNDADLGAGGAQCMMAPFDVAANNGATLIYDCRCVRPAFAGIPNHYGAVQGDNTATDIAALSYSDGKVIVRWTDSDSVEREYIFGDVNTVDVYAWHQVMVLAYKSGSDLIVGAWVRQTSDDPWIGLWLIGGDSVDVLAPILGGPYTRTGIDPKFVTRAHQFKTGFGKGAIRSAAMYLPTADPVASLGTLLGIHEASDMVGKVPGDTYTGTRDGLTHTIADPGTTHYGWVPSERSGMMVGAATEVPFAHPELHLGSGDVTMVFNVTLHTVNFGAAYYAWTALTLNTTAGMGLVDFTSYGLGVSLLISDGTRWGGAIGMGAHLTAFQPSVIVGVVNRSTNLFHVYVDGTEITTFFNGTSPVTGPLDISAYGSLGTDELIFGRVNLSQAMFHKGTGVTPGLAISAARVASLTAELALA